MEKVEQYRRYAAKCRDMARTGPLSHCQDLQQMAESWEHLADDADKTGLVIEFAFPNK